MLPTRGTRPSRCQVSSQRFHETRPVIPSPLAKLSDQTCKLIGMPELPDITAYIAALEPRSSANSFSVFDLLSSFLLRTFNRQSDCYCCQRNFPVLSDRHGDSTLADNRRDGALCEICKGAHWVCEDHADRTWGGVSNRETACRCGGAGMPCLACNGVIASTSRRCLLAIGPSSTGMVGDIDVGMFYRARKNLHRKLLNRSNR